MKLFSPVSGQDFQRPGDSVLDSLAIGLVRNPEFEVLDSVVELVPVAVVDVLAGQEGAFEGLSHDVAVLQHPGVVGKPNPAIPVCCGAFCSSNERPSLQSRTTASESCRVSSRSSSPSLVGGTQSDRPDLAPITPGEPTERPSRVFRISPTRVVSSAESSFEVLHVSGAIFDSTDHWRRVHPS